MKTEELLKIRAPLAPPGGSSGLKKKNFRCQICNQSFVDNWKLNRHIKIHARNVDALGREREFIPTPNYIPSPNYVPSPERNYIAPGRNIIPPARNYVPPERNYESFPERKYDVSPEGKTVTKNFKCEICHKAFRDNWKLKRHGNVHGINDYVFPERKCVPPEGKTVTKNFKCEICQKAFRDNWKLKRHEKVHVKATGEPELVGHSI